MVGKRKKSLTGKKEAKKIKTSAQNRRSDSENRAREQEVQTRRRRQARQDNPERRAEEQEDNSSRRRQTRLANPGQRAQEQEEDSSRRRQTRLANPGQRAQEQEENSSRRRQTRLANPGQRAQEQEEDSSRRRQTRLANPGQRAQEQEENSSRRRQTRLANPEKRAREQAANTLQHQRRRKSPEARGEEQARNSRQKRLNRVLSWEDAAARFETAIKDGPSHRCRSCDRLFFEKQTKIRTRKHMNEIEWTDELIAELVVENHVNDAEFIFCSTCNTYFTKRRKKPQPGEEVPPKKFPRFNANKSNLKFPVIPEEVANLSPLEERCVALRIPFMKIQALGCDRQYGIKSGVVNVPVDVRRTIKAIPAPSDNGGIIEVSLMRKMKYKGFYMKERIRPDAVWRAAELLSNSELYQNEGILLNRNWEEEETERERQQDEQAAHEKQQQQSPEQANEVEMIEEEAIEIAQLQAAFDAGELMELDEGPEPDPDAVEQNEGYIEEETMIDAAEGIAFAPGEGQKPIPMFLDKYCKEMSWPTIWGGNPCPETPEGIKISESDKSYHEILRFDRRACKPPYLLFLHKCETIRQLRNATNIALRKSAQTNIINAGEVLNRQFIENAVRKDHAYRFMSNVVGSPSYWEDKKRKVLAMVRQFGIFSLFITLTAAETKWTELIVILKKVLDKEDITPEEAAKLPFEELSRLIRSDPVTCARYFDHRFKELMKTWTHSNDGPFGESKIVDMFYRIEFQHRGSPHVHMVIWLENAPKYDCDRPESEEVVVDFIDSIITTKGDDPDIADQIGKQLHKCSHTCFRDGQKKKCRFNAPFRPMDRTRILKPVLKDEDEQMHPDIKNKITKFNQQIDNELNHNSKDLLTLDDLLKKMAIDLELYILATRKTIKRPKIFLKREPEDCRINAYNKKILSLMRSNMDIQYVLDAFACIGYIVDYINKSARGLSRLLRLCIEDCRNGNKSIMEQMKCLSHILYTCSEICAQEAAQCRLRLPMCFTSRCVEFINSSPKEDRQRMLKNEAELKKLPPDSTDIYKKGLIERYAERSDELKPFCLAEFASKFTFCNKNGLSLEESEEDAPQEIDLDANPDRAEEEEVLEEADDNGAATTAGRPKLKSYPLKDGSGVMKERKKSKVIRYCRFSFHKEPEKYLREMCFLYFPWRDEEADIDSKSYQELYTANEETIKINFRKFNYCDLDFDIIAAEIEKERLLEELTGNDKADNEDDEDPLFVNVFDFDANVIQPNAAQEMGFEVAGGETVSKYSVPGILEKANYLKLMDSLNAKQRDIVMDINSKASSNDGPFHYFLTGGAGTGKSQTIKAIHQSLSRQLREKSSEDTSIEILIVSFTGMAAHNVEGMTAHAAFHLPAGKSEDIKQASPSFLNTLRANLHNLKYLIIDEISMCSAKLVDWINYRLREIFGTPLDVQFGGISVIFVGDFNQLPPVGGRLAFQTKDRNSPAVMCGNPQWELFKMFRLTEIMRQRDDLVFAEALNRLAVGRCTPEDITIWNNRVFKEEELPERALNATRLYEYHKYIDEYNRVAVSKKRNGAAFDITCKAEDRILGAPTTTKRNQALRALNNLPAHRAQGMPAEIDLVEGVRYMMTVNVDVIDGRYNGALGTLRRLDFERVPGEQRSKPGGVWLEFDCPSIGANARREKKAYMEANKIPATWTPIYRISKQIQLLDRGEVTVNRFQYPLVIAESRTIHKSQGLTVDTVVIDSKGKKMDRAKTYTSISRARTLDGVFIMDKFFPPHPPAPNDAVINEMLRMETDCKIVPRFKELRIRSPDEYLQIISHNVQSLNSHLSSIICDTTYTNSDIMMLQESWMKTSDMHEIESFAELTRNHFDTKPNGKGTIIYSKNRSSQGFSEIPSVEKRESGHCEITGVLVDVSLLLLNVYKNPTCKKETFVEAMNQHANLIERFDNVLVMGDFKDDVKNGSSFNNFMAETYGLHLMSPEKPTTISGTCIDGVFGKLADFNINCKIYYSYFSVHFPLVTKLFKK